MKKNGGFNIVLGEWGPNVNNPAQSVPTILTMIVALLSSIISLNHNLIANFPGLVDLSSPFQLNGLLELELDM